MNPLFVVPLLAYTLAATLWPGARWTAAAAAAPCSLGRPCS